MRLLLLAGTREARLLAKKLAAMPRIDAIASLAGATRTPAELALPTRCGGFGGKEAFRDYLKAAGIEAVLDATHPFAERISRRTAEICRGEGLPHAMVLRPEWRPRPGDDWTELDCAENAAGIIPDGAAVFLATGPHGVERFANLQGRKVICRRIEQPERPFPFPGGVYLVDRPPFSMEDELSLFRRLEIDWLIVKNSGGDASRPKLDAARVLGIKVALLRRPPVPDAVLLRSVDEAIDWARRLP